MLYEWTKKMWKKRKNTERHTVIHNQYISVYHLQIHILQKLYGHNWEKTCGRIKTVHAHVVFTSIHYSEFKRITPVGLCQLLQNVRWWNITRIICNTEKADSMLEEQHENFSKNFVIELGANHFFNTFLYQH